MIIRHKIKKKASKSYYNSEYMYLCINVLIITKEIKH